MAPVTIHSDFGAQGNKIYHCFHFSPSVYHEMMEPDTMILVFWILNFKPGFLLSSLTLIKRLFSYSLISAFRVVSSAYLRLLIFLLVILIPACASSNLAFCLMYSAYKLNKQGDSIQSCCTPFPIWNQFYVPCKVLTVASWPVYQFLRRQVWYSHLFKNFPQFVVIHMIKGFHVVSEAEVDVFSEIPLLSLWANECWQFGLWFFCLFWTQLVQL